MYGQSIELSSVLREFSIPSSNWNTSGEKKPESNSNWDKGLSFISLDWPGGGRWWWRYWQCWHQRWARQLPHRNWRAGGCGQSATPCSARACGTPARPRGSHATLLSAGWHSSTAQSPATMNCITKPKLNKNWFFFYKKYIIVFIL